MARQACYHLGVVFAANYRGADYLFTCHFSRPAILAEECAGSRKGSELDDFDVKRLQGSFPRVFARKAQLAERFYAYLFDQLPEVKPLFSAGMSRQREMFSAMLASSVQALSDPEETSEKIRYLRASHARLELTPAQLQAGANALMGALLEVLGEELSDEEVSSWARAIVLLVRAMAPPDSEWEGPDQTDMQMYFISR